jgi:hypothetical protein
MIVLYELTDLAFIGKGIKMYPEPAKRSVLIMFNSILKPMNRTIEYVRESDNRMVFDRHLEFFYADASSEDSWRVPDPMNLFSAVIRDVDVYYHDVEYRVGNLVVLSFLVYC